MYVYEYMSYVGIVNQQLTDPGMRAQEQVMCLLYVFVCIANWIDYLIDYYVLLISCPFFDGLFRLVVVVVVAPHKHTRDPK